MAFLFPEELLDLLTCDVCHKLLSVRPIKMYPDHKIKCGRCSTTNDEGVISTLGFVAQQATFKCINRFDGCTKLLLTSQVASHESGCSSSSYKCPLCPLNLTLHTFEMIMHFNQCHEVSVLTKNYFEITADDRRGMLFFRKRDFLFYIFYKIDDENWLGIEAFLLGDKCLAQAITQQFTFYNDFGVNRTNTKRCKPYNSESIDNFRVSKRIVRVIEDINIHFELDIDIIAPFYYQPTMEEFKEHRTLSRIEYFVEACRATGISWPHVLIRFNPPVQRFILSDDSTYVTKTNLNGSKTKIFLCCFNCYRLAANNALIQINDNYYGICRVCACCCKTLRPVIPWTLILPIPTFLSLNELVACPIEGCYRRDTIPLLRFHMNRDHGKQMITTSSFSLDFLNGRHAPSQVYVFVIPYFILVTFVLTRVHGDVCRRVTMSTTQLDPKISIHFMLENRATRVYRSLEHLNNIIRLELHNDYAWLFLECHA